MGYRYEQRYSAASLSQDSWFKDKFVSLRSRPVLDKLRHSKSDCLLFLSERFRGVATHFATDGRAALSTVTICDSAANCSLIHEKCYAAYCCHDPTNCLGY